MRTFLIICLLLLAGCRSATTRPPVAPETPPVMVEMSPEHKAMVYQLMMAVDPNVFAYREPSLDERFGIK